MERLQRHDIHFANVSSGGTGGVRLPHFMHSYIMFEDLDDLKTIDFEDQTWMEMT